MRSGPACIALLVEPPKQSARLLGIGAGVSVQGLDSKLVVEGPADHVENRLLGRANRDLAVPQDLLGDEVGRVQELVVRNDLRTRLH